MADAFELLKSCNLQLEALKSKSHRYVAWICYSTHNGSYVSGVDRYPIGDFDYGEKCIIVQCYDESGIGALARLDEHIRKEWMTAGNIPMEPEFQII